AYIPTPMSAAVAITAITTVLNGKSTPLRNPNAAPLFRTWVKSTSPGTIVRLACTGSVARISALVPWSAATITIGSQTSSHRGGFSAASRSPASTTSSSVLSIHRLGKGVLAAVAQAGPRRIGRHLRHVAPAALALDATGPLDDDARPRLGVRFHVVGRRPQLHVGDDEDHRQLLRVRLELRKLRRGRRYDDLRLQRAADSLVLPQRLDLGEHLHAQIGKTLPPRDEIGVGEGVELGRRREDGHV